MAKSKQNEVAETPNRPTAVAVPDFMKADIGKGTENIGQSDIEIPRVVLLQSLSPMVTEQGMKAGQFYHTLLEEELGATLDIVPVYCDIRYLLFRPRHDGGGILARANDGKHWVPGHGEFTVQPIKGVKKNVTWKLAPTVSESGLADWGSSNPEDPNSQPAANKIFNVAAFCPSRPEIGPFVISMQRSSAKAGARLMGKLKLANAPSYGLIYEMSAFLDSNGTGDEFWGYRFTGKGFVQEEDTYNYGKAMYERFRDRGLEVKDEADLDESDAEAASAAAADPKGGKDF